MWYELAASYGLSLLISLITGIVEASAPLCSEIAPNFGKTSCFFHGMYCFKNPNSMYINIY